MAVELTHTADSSPTSYYSVTGLDNIATTGGANQCTVTLHENPQSNTDGQFPFAYVNSSGEGFEIARDPTSNKFQTEHWDGSNSLITSTTSYQGSGSWGCIGVIVERTDGTFNSVIDLYYATSRTADGSYVNGGTNLANHVSNKDRVYIGRSSFGGGAAYEGYVRDVCLWNYGLTVDELDMLNRGISPLKMPNGPPYYWWPLTQEDDLRELIRGATLTKTETDPINTVDDAVRLPENPWMGHNIKAVAGGADVVNPIISARGHSNVIFGGQVIRG